MRIWIAFVVMVLLVACDQNVDRVNTGERLEDAPPVEAVQPSAGGAAPLERPAGMESEVPPFVKAYFMHMFVEALYSTPQNKMPNPNWTSPLKDPVNGRVWCTDCHVSGQVNFANIPKQRLPMVDQYEQDREFMKDLMTKWVARLNSDEYFAKAKIKEEVTCTTCHATDPREE